jgi:hypothetical protein
VKNVKRVNIKIVKLNQRVVTQFPFDEIWNDEKVVSREFIRHLVETDIKKLLPQSQVHFVIIQVGLKPKWIAPNECFNFWKNEVRQNLAKDKRIYLEDYPNHFCYVASEWVSNLTLPIVVLEIWS